MDFSLIIPAFIAGVLTFLAPCTLPLVPGYLGFISGVSLDELKDPAKSKKARWKIFINGLFFVIGFSIVFIILGTLVGFAGRLLYEYRVWLSRIGGIFVILFGLFMTGIIKVDFFEKERRIRIPQLFKRGRPLNSFILGSAFAFGWTPCVGPVLGSMLTLAAVSSTALQGSFLLLVFSLGLAIPFLLVALLAGQASKYINKISKYVRVIYVVGGLFLIFMGILLLTNSMELWIAYSYRLFDFINYDKLLDYL